MRKIVLFLALMVFKFGMSQGIIHVKVVSYKKSGFDNLKWLAYTNIGDSIFCKEKPKIGMIKYYKDALNGSFYNKSEYETDIFETALKNTRIG